jgi:uncharacterized protein YcbX
MALLTELSLYPIKSCAGIALGQAVLRESGLSAGGVHDREWMLVDDDGRFLTQREFPAMATIRPEFAAGGEGLLVRAPGATPLALGCAIDPYAMLATVTIWDDRVVARDAGDDAASWFSGVLGTSCRLVRCKRSQQRLANPAWTNGVAAPTLFSDGFPVLVISEASLADLNTRLLAQYRDALPMNRFRPNVVLGGTDPYEEDFAATMEIGAAVLRASKPCPRCPIPSIDQAPGVAGPNPLDILQTYRAMEKLNGGIAFGMNAIVETGAGATLHVGQEVTINLAF